DQQFVYHLKQRHPRIRQSQKESRSRSRSCLHQEFRSAWPYLCPVPEISITFVAITMDRRRGDRTQPGPVSRWAGSNLFSGQSGAASPVRFVKTAWKLGTERG